MQKYKACLSSDKRFANRSIELVDNYTKYLLKEWWRVNNTVKDYEKLSEQYNKMIAERNSLIDDLSWYKAKISRLERENEKLKDKLKD